ncbi:bifunctional protein HldE-like [Anneissia japonica]|uniref:bifunctional protein HldE-like n=1 Tax=Anneissia japonica TaxID=1529436 RepID=UPI001425A1D5|nr:bifunctional protein HldE-like [Anneissia japonica]
MALLSLVYRSSFIERMIITLLSTHYIVDFPTINSFGTACHFPIFTGHIYSMMTQSKPMKVLVIGDFMYDKYHYGKTTKISCEAFLPVFGKEHLDIRLGGAGNVALTCHHHAEVTLVSAFLENECPAVPFKLVNLPGKTVTTVKERFIIGERHVFRSDQEKYEPINIDDVNTDGYDVILISDYNKGVIHSPQKLIRNAKCPVLVDPKGDDWSKYAGAYCLKPNLKEFENVCGKFTVENARTALKTYKIEAILVTLGQNGVTWVTLDNEIHIGATAEKVVDVTGAGDTFISIFACYLNESDVGDTVKIANTAAGVAVEHFGTYVVTKRDIWGQIQHDGLTGTTNEVQPVIPYNYSIGTTHDILPVHKVTPMQKCQEKVSPEEQEEQSCRRGQATKEKSFESGWKSTNGVEPMTNASDQSIMTRQSKKKEVVVFTNGCFDIVHVTHVNLLQKAKSLGDRLIVGLNSDASVTRIKRKPINNQERRKMLLEAFSCVDEVIIFDEDSPRNLILKLKPDILVKGGDYELEDLRSRHLVKKAVIIPSYCEVTTSRIMKECQKRLIESDCKKKVLPEAYTEALGSTDWTCTPSKDAETCLVCDQTDRTSQQIVQKKWGFENIFVSNASYAGKFLHFDIAGSKFSMHFHAVKTETWYVLRGSFHLVLDVYKRQ